MTPPIVRSLAGLTVFVVLLAASSARLRRGPTLSAGFQLVATFGVFVVVLTHLAESLNLFRSFGWGQPHSVGHYIDLFGAMCAGVFFVLSLVAYRTNLSE